MIAKKAAAARWGKKGQEENVKDQQNDQRVIELLAGIHRTLIHMEGRIDRIAQAVDAINARAQQEQDPADR